MLIDYIGQELIWNLLGTNHYSKASDLAKGYNITIMCRTPKQNDDAAWFIISHIPQDKIISVVYQDTPFVCGDEKVVKEIKVLNVFGRESIVTFLNEDDYEVDEQIQELTDKNRLKG